MPMPAAAEVLVPVPAAAEVLVPVPTAVEETTEAGSPEAAGTGAASRAGGAGSPAPTAPISRMGRRKAQWDKKVAPSPRRRGCPGESS